MSRTVSDTQQTLNKHGLIKANEYKDIYNNILKIKWIKSCYFIMKYVFSVSKHKKTSISSYQISQKSWKDASVSSFGYVQSFYGLTWVHVAMEHKLMIILMHHLCSYTLHNNSKLIWQKDSVTCPEKESVGLWNLVVSLHDLCDALGSHPVKQSYQ